VPKHQSEFIILCEDRQQEIFARYFLTGCGVHPHKIRLRLPVRGKGSGEQYVRENYPKEVKAYRSRSTHLSVCLAVLIDADVKSVNDRTDELVSALKANGLPPRGIDEKIAHFIPKRNIETWIFYLHGELVDEEINYKREIDKETLRSSVERLVQLRSKKLPDDAPPSLHSAAHELHRILPLNKIS